jgi:hypothetical protein
MLFPYFRLAGVAPCGFTNSLPLGHNTGPDNERLTLEDTVAMSDEILRRPQALEEAILYLNDFEISSPTLFKIVVDGANEISAMLFPECDVKGRLWYRCVQCGKPWDRWNRARDCPNSHLKIRPYECRGHCGNASWFVQMPLPFLRLSAHGA